MNLKTQKQQQQKSVAKSCESRLENELQDIDQHKNNNIRIVKSFEGSFSQDQNQGYWQQSDALQKQQRRNALVSELRQVKQVQKIHDQYANNHYKGKQFASEIIKSEEVSIDEQFNGKSQNSMNQKEQEEKKRNFLANNSDIEVLKQKRMQQMQQPIQFNIMLVGAASMGKSSFIDAFLHKKYQVLPIIRQRTDKIQVISSTRDYRQIRVNLDFIDTPGYRSNNVDEYIKILINYMNEKFQQHKKKQDSQFRKSKIFQQKNFKDQRVHCILYFLKGPRIQEDDWTIMAEIQKCAQIIPVIAKGDTFTVEQIKKIKDQIRKEKRKYEVQWFDLQQFMRQKYNHKLDSIMKGPFGEAPPFVLSGCLEKVLIADKHEKQGIQFCRTYKWGTCYLDNPQHTDFQLLKNVLIYYLSAHAKGFAETYYRQYHQQNRQIIKQQQQPKTGQIKRWVIGGALAITIIGGIVAKKFNLIPDFKKN